VGGLFVCVVALVVLMDLIMSHIMQNQGNNESPKLSTKQPKYQTDNTLTDKSTNYQATKHAPINNQAATNKHTPISKQPTTMS
jgi:hypothetical protein